MRHIDVLGLGHRETFDAIVALFSNDRYCTECNEGPEHHTYYPDPLALYISNRNHRRECARVLGLGSKSAVFMEQALGTFAERDARDRDEEWRAKFCARPGSRIDEAIERVAALSRLLENRLKQESLSRAVRELC